MNLKGNITDCHYEYCSNCDGGLCAVIAFWVYINETGRVWQECNDYGEWEVCLFGNVGYGVKSCDYEYECTFQYRGTEHCCFFEPVEQGGCGFRSCKDSDFPFEICQLMKACPVDLDSEIPWATVAPSSRPTVSAIPTSLPSLSPTDRQTKEPTNDPTVIATKLPVKTKMPSSSKPSSDPTVAPVDKPIKSPVDGVLDKEEIILTDLTLTPVRPRTPTKTPSKEPTGSRTNSPPTKPPTKVPSKEPTLPPTDNPTTKPTTKPTKSPTKMPTETPTLRPTTKATSPPTKDLLSSTPTRIPSLTPIDESTNLPTSSPTTAPIQTTTAPTSSPTASPTPESEGFRIPGETLNPTPTPTLQDVGFRTPGETLNPTSTPTTSTTKVPSPSGRIPEKAKNIFGSESEGVIAVDAATTGDTTGKESIVEEESSSPENDPSESTPEAIDGDKEESKLISATSCERTDLSFVVGSILLLCLSFVETM